MSTKTPFSPPRSPSVRPGKLLSDLRSYWKKSSHLRATHSDVQTPSGIVHVDVKQPLTTYNQIPSDLSNVTAASYVGVP